jgi:hypothetical protein
MAGAPVIPLAKKGPGVRPIAIGETFRRLVSKVGAFHVRSAASQLLAPLQLGVGTPLGCEAILHPVNTVFAAHGGDSLLALLKIDLSNAFNVVSCDAILAASPLGSKPATPKAPIFSHMTDVISAALGFSKVTRLAPCFSLSFSNQFSKPFSSAAPPYASMSATWTTSR